MITAAIRQDIHQAEAVLRRACPINARPPQLSRRRTNFQFPELMIGPIYTAEEYKLRRQWLDQLRQHGVPCQVEEGGYLSSTMFVVFRVDARDTIPS